MLNSGRLRRRLRFSAAAVGVLLALGASGAGPGGRKHGKANVVGVLNVNRASEAELRLLPGIGKGRAARIVERRDKHPFASVDEVARIRGLRKLVQRLRPHLVVEGDSTLRPAPSVTPSARP